MKLFNIFTKQEILTPAERIQLEKLDEKCVVLRSLRERVDREWPSAGDRIGRLQALTDELIQRPNDVDLWHRMEIVACMPSNIQHGYQHREAVMDRIGQEIERRMLPENAICRRVFQRALRVAENELAKVEKLERASADEEEYGYMPSGKVLALQLKVQNLRNACATPLPEEQDPFRSPGNWKERLVEFI